MEFTNSGTKKLAAVSASSLKYLAQAPKSLTTTAALADALPFNAQETSSLAKSTANASVCQKFAQLA